MTSQAVLFDLDGTLVDSAPDIAIALDRALAANGHPPVGELNTRSYIGSGASRLVHRALTGERWHDAEPALFDKVLKAFQESYSEHICNDSAPSSPSVSFK